MPQKSYGNAYQTVLRTIAVVSERLMGHEKQVRLPLICPLAGADEGKTTPRGQNGS